MSEMEGESAIEATEQQAIAPETNASPQEMEEPANQPKLGVDEVEEEEEVKNEEGVKIEGQKEEMEKEEVKTEEVEKEKARKEEVEKEEERKEEVEKEEEKAETVKAERNEGVKTEGKVEEGKKVEYVPPEDDEMNLEHSPSNDKLNLEKSEKDSFAEEADSSDMLESHSVENIEQEGVKEGRKDEEKKNDECVDLKMSLARQFILLFLNLDKGVFPKGNSLSRRIALVGALLMDLALSGHISVKDVSKKKNKWSQIEKPLLILNFSTPTGDEVKDDILKILDAAPSPLPIESWIKDFSGESLRSPNKLKDLEKRVMEVYVKDGSCTCEEAKSFFRTTTTKFLLNNVLKEQVKKLQGELYEVSKCYEVDEHCRAETLDEAKLTCTNQLLFLLLASSEQSIHSLFEVFITSRKERQRARRCAKYMRVKSEFVAFICPKAVVYEIDQIVSRLLSSQSSSVSLF